jgi:phenylacetate-CoA ligase
MGLPRPSQLYWSAYLAGHLRGQARYPFRQISLVLQDQARRVQAMVAYAYRYVPYYREAMDRLGLSPTDFRTAADLAKLPVLETLVYHRDPERFLSTAQPKERYLEMRTGGSTGIRRTIWHDTAALFQNAAHAERERCLVTALLGQKVGYRETVITTTPEGSTPRRVQNYLREHAWFPRRLGIERQYISVFDPIEKNLALLNEFQPDILHSNGSYLVTLFGYLKNTGTPFHHPRAVTYGSEGVSDSVRRIISEDFGIPIFSTYQATEALKIGFECDQHLGFHLNVDLYPVRVVDPEGQTVEPGERGEVVISNLVNRATVILNYRLNDLATLLPRSCPCGRTLPLLSFLQGRGRDFIQVPSGEMVHPDVTATVFSRPEVWQYQVVQDRPDHLTVKLIVADGTDRAATQAAISADFARLYGAGVSYDLSFVDSLERTPGGKIKPISALPRGDEGEANGT